MEKGGLRCLFFDEFTSSDLFPFYTFCPERLRNRQNDKNGNTDQR